VTETPEAPRLTTDAAMEEVRTRVRAELRKQLIAHGASSDLADERVFGEVDALLRRALASDDRQALLMPALLADEWRPELSLRLAGHRPGLTGAVVLFAKRRLLLPLTRWLFEYALENFRRQDRLNAALMACVQTLAAEHVRLRARVDALEAAPHATRGVSPADPPLAR
jgi:hypothetical protein